MPSVTADRAFSLQNVTLYTSLESCAQCSGVMSLGGVKQVVYLQNDFTAYMIGNIVVSIIAVVLAGLYQDWLTTRQALLLGAAVGAAAPLGDLFESYLKRDVGTKDTGRLFGPHGGALDRLDAAMFTMVAGFYVWQAML